MTAIPSPDPTILKDHLYSPLACRSVSEKRRCRSGDGTGILFTNICSAFSQAAVAIVKVNVDVVAKGWRASKLIGSMVRNDKNDRVGTIHDIIIDKDKK